MFNFTKLFVNVIRERARMNALETIPQCNQDVQEYKPSAPCAIFFQNKSLVRRGEQNLS